MSVNSDQLVHLAPKLIMTVHEYYSFQVFNILLDRVKEEGMGLVLEIVLLFLRSSNILV